MPTYSEADRIIEVYLNSNWAFTPIAFENVSALDLTNVNRPPLAEGSDPYISLRTFYNTSSAAEIGVGDAAIKRTWGNLAIDFHMKEDKGTVANKTNIDNLSNLFEYKTISGIVFRDLTVLRPITNQGWYITPTMVRFYFNR